VEGHALHLRPGRSARTGQLPQPDAVKKFIALTYEKYYARFPGRFGSTIGSAFYDEPTMHWLQGGRGWTPEFTAGSRAARLGSGPALSGAVVRHRAETAAARNALFASAPTCTPMAS